MIDDKKIEKKIEDSVAPKAQSERLRMIEIMRDKRMSWLEEYILSKDMFAATKKVFGSDMGMVQLAKTTQAMRNLNKHEIEALYADKKISFEDKVKDLAVLGIEEYERQLGNPELPFSEKQKIIRDVTEWSQWVEKSQKINVTHEYRKLVSDLWEDDEKIIEGVIVPAVDNKKKV